MWYEVKQQQWPLRYFFIYFSISKKESLREAFSPHDTVSQQEGAKLHFTSNQQQELASKASSA
jgi:hypothetical protein